MDGLRLALCGDLVSTCMIELRELTVCYGDQTVLGPIRLVVPEGRTTVVIGPSGSGKSTLLRAILGLVHPTRGEVLVDGVSLAHADILALRRRFGYVVQGGGLFPHMRARANVTLMASYAGWERSRIEARVAELAELTGIGGELLERYPDELSGGQQQRVSLMRALMLDPPILLLDEPLGALDPLVRFDLQQDLRAIFARLSKTVVLVTHDLAEASFFADEIVLLRDGRVEQRGGFADLLEQPASDFVRRFVRAQRAAFDPASSPA